MLLLHIFPGKSSGHLNIMELTSLHSPHEMTFHQGASARWWANTLGVLSLQFVSIESLEWPTFTTRTSLVSLKAWTFVWSDGTLTLFSGSHLTFEVFAGDELGLKDLRFEMVWYTFFFSAQKAFDSAGKTSYRLHSNLFISRWQILILFYFLYLYPGTLFFAH